MTRWFKSRVAGHLFLRGSTDRQLTVMVMECTHCGQVEEVSLAKQDNRFHSISREFHRRHRGCLPLDRILTPAAEGGAA